MKILDIIYHSGEQSEIDWISEDGHRKYALEILIFQQNLHSDITGNPRCKLIFLLELSLLYA